MKSLWMASVLAVLAAPAFAVIGTVDDVPAATLLLPYFEVDLDDPEGVTTLMSINNASATAALAHVVVWTDLSIHVLDFNVYLTGYDVQSINLRDIFVDGNLPITASDGQDPADTISPQGPASQDINFASCTGLLPYSNPALDALYIDHLQSTLTGQSSDVFFGGLCAGIDHGDRIARGYVTVDTVNFCSTNFPPDVGYFISGGAGTAANQNVLWGDYFYVYPEQNFSQGETLVHIEAASLPDFVEGVGAGSYTFYYRYSLGADNREGLGNIFAVRYIDGGAFDGGTSLLTWRDAKRTINPFSCALPFPAPFPLGQNQVVVFDEEENFEVPEGCTVSPCPPTQGLQPFPWEAQRTLVRSSALPTTPNFGWIYLNLNSAVAGSQVPFEPLMQNWVTAIMDAKGTMSIGFDALQLGNVTDPLSAPDILIGLD
jgi:hypothetical protein